MANFYEHVKLMSEKQTKASKHILVWIITLPGINVHCMRGTHIDVYVYSFFFHPVNFFRLFSIAKISKHVATTKENEKKHSLAVINNTLHARTHSVQTI